MSAASRRALLLRALPQLCAAVWEELCRVALPALGGQLHIASPLLPAQRFWQGNAAEWDAVSQTIDQRQALLGKAKWTVKPCSYAYVQRQAQRLSQRELPPPLQVNTVHYALCVSELSANCPAQVDGVWAIEAQRVLEVLR